MFIETAKAPLISKRKLNYRKRVLTKRYQSDTSHSDPDKFAKMNQKLENPV